MPERESCLYVKIVRQRRLPWRLTARYRFARGMTSRTVKPWASIALRAATRFSAAFRKTSAGQRLILAFQTIDGGRRAAGEWIEKTALRDGTLAPLGWVGSITLHSIIALLMILTWYSRQKIDEHPAAYVPVNLVTVSDETNVAPTSKPAFRIQPLAIIAPPVPLDLDMSIPSLPLVEADSEPPPAKLPDSSTAQNPLPINAGQLAPKQDPNQTEISAQSVQKPPDVTTPVPSASLNSKPADRLLPGAGPGTASTANLVSLLRSQIEACWSPPVTAARPTQFVIDVEISLNPDGSIAKPPRMVGDSAAAAPHDPAIRAVADALRNAIYSCAPYRLPAGLYAQWRDINPLHFDHSAAPDP